MATFTVGFWKTEFCTALNIEANTAEEAEEWLFDELCQNDTDEIEYQVNNHDYGTQDAKEIK